MKTQKPQDIALAYINALAQHDYDAIANLLAPNVVLVGPAATRTGAVDLLAAFKRLSAIHVRSDVRRVFVDDNEVCVIYDFVTDTPAGVVPTIEWMKIEDGTIRSINLYYDRVPWQIIGDEMQKRSAA